MAITIRDPRIEQLAREAAEQSGKDLTQVIMHALDEYLRKLPHRKHSDGLFAEIIETSKRWDRSGRSIWGIMNDAVITTHQGPSTATRGGFPSRKAMTCPDMSGPAVSNPPPREN